MGTKLPSPRREGGAARSSEEPRGAAGVTINVESPELGRNGDSAGDHVGQWEVSKRQGYNPIRTHSLPPLPTSTTWPQEDKACTP
ncbi:hypothetical protein AAFF_G00402070 [Aldrovandia affinis]|uniref:Uncharacterized protein n=1 Tax=Aldrovandia affinis TaxID=143900 RepID=A0AAD7X0D8_9TELE|nr:hypothetical protein AAFF_G00402070 [Aldrovandia affinis]